MFGSSRLPLRSYNELPPTPPTSSEANQSTVFSTATTTHMPSISPRESDLMVPISRGTPGDDSFFSPARPQTRAQKELNKRKSQYYNHVFDDREKNGLAKERAAAECMVVVELQTNVIINDEFTFITSLSSYFSERYHRPDSSISVSVAHSACLFFAGSFDPAYILTVSTTKELIQPATNQRNTHVIQEFLNERLKVTSDRGVIKFMPVAEENFGMGGTTLAAEMERMQRVGKEEREKVAGKRPSAKKRSSTKSMRNLSVGLGQNGSAGGNRNLQVPEERRNGNANGTGVLQSVDEWHGTGDKMEGKLSRSADQPAVPPVPIDDSDGKAEKVRKMGRRKSFMAMFGK